MMKKILRIFRKDATIARRDSMLIYIIAIPILLAVGIVFFAPGVTDSASTIALLESDTADHIEYMEDYVQVEIVDSMEELERRINKRDDVVGVVPIDQGYEIIIEGNEDEAYYETVKAMSAFYKIGATRENTTAEILDFGKTVPPLKTTLANALILMVIMLAGMIIALGIVEEKSDKTIKAMNVTPISQNTFIIGKGMLGGVVAMGSIIISLLIMGYNDINWLMLILIGLTSMILTFIVGFLQGLASKDVIEAAGGVKLIMLPIAAAIAAYEILADKWQWTMYWNPFYWAYRANDLILSKTADWGIVLISAALVTILSIAVYLIAIPKIRKGLS
ncbi:MAG: ABC transporter permease [Carnobacterium sp.]|nr:ABC transporter permease [Carnobacterium sp.]